MYKISLKTGIIPIIFGIGLVLMVSSSVLSAQCNMMKGHGNHSGHDMKKMESADTTIIRKGIIDVFSIDVNKDGFVYQDQMDWNVISDKQGKCPLCGMEMQKVKIKDAIINLKKHDFEVKE